MLLIYFSFVFLSVTLPLPKDRFVAAEKAESLERKKVRAEENAKGWRGAVRERSGSSPVALLLDFIVNMVSGLPSLLTARRVSVCSG